MDLKEFIFSAMLTVLGEGAEVPHIVIAEMPDPYRGLTECAVYEQSGTTACKVTFDKGTMSDERKAHSRDRFTQRENTIVHELCHVEVYYAAAEEGKEHVAGVWTYDAAGHDGGKHHGKDWRKCMRKMGARIDKKVRHP